MRLPYLFALLIGLLSRFSFAVDGGPPVADMSNWDIDPSCEPYRRALDEGFDVALEMAIAALDALEFLRKPQPPKRQRKQHLEWLIKSRSLKAVLGLTVPEDGANPSDDFIFAQTVLSRMKTRLTQSPNRVWNMALINLGYTKPHIVCGENTEGENANFQWVGENDPVPKEGGVLLKDYRVGKLYLAKGYKGAWFHHGRMVFVAAVKQKGFICGPGFSASTSYRYDWIAICAHALRPEAMSRISPKTYKETDGKTKKKKERIDDKIAVGTPLRNIARHLSITVLHELFHWYGYPNVNAQGQAIPDTYSKPTSQPLYLSEGESTKTILTSEDIDDVHAVDKDGKYLYKRTWSNQVDLKASKELLSSKEMEEEKLWIAVAYGQKHVWNLAKLLHGDKSIKPVGNADSMAYFALMVYLDAWDWSKDGIAAEKTLESPP